jgi:hypothetical protein
MKGQDVLLLVKLLSDDEQQRSDGRSKRDIEAKSFRDLSWELAMSTSEVHAAQRRLEKAELLAPERRVRRRAAGEFLLHGFKYVFPAHPGELALGMRTGRAAPPLRKYSTLLLDSAEDVDLVWPWEKGEVRGRTIVPIYKSVPDAAHKDESLYLWLSLLDCLRAGRARDRQFATARIRQRLRHGRSSPE